jgi:bleomycin hydrolase
MPLKHHKKLLALALILISFALFSDKGAKKGAIDSPLLAKMRGQAIEKGKINVITNNSIRKLIINRSHVGKIDHHFSVKLDVKGITNQKSTGRCWLFTSLNIIRQKVRKKLDLKEFEFSENYSFFWDQLEKANLFLEGIITTVDRDFMDRKVRWLFKNPVGDGGVWNMAVAIIEKYGLVPKSVMPETYHSSSTREMRNMIRTKLREDGIRLRQLHQKGESLPSMRKAKEKMLMEIYKLLVYHLGEPPAQFSWRYIDRENKISQAKQFTPLQFYRQCIQVNLRDYIMFMNDPTRPYYKLYEIQYDRDVVEAFNWTYINLPNKDLKQFAEASLKDGEAMYFSCDVGKQLNRGKGILSLKNYDYESLYGIQFRMSKKERILAAASGSTHGMALVGFDRAKDGPITKWLLENSWGKKAGNKGYLTMTDRWFDEYGFRLVIHKKYIPQKVLRLLKTKAVQLHPWDPMFLPIEDN